MVIGKDYLPDPYYAIAEVISYAGLVWLVAGKLRACLRLARGSEYEKQLHVVVFWVGLGVLAVMGRLGDLFGTRDRDYIRFVTSGSLYLALLYALQLVQRLQKRSAVGAGGDSMVEEGAWQELANDPGQKINAIKAYREQHDVGLAEAKKAVEDYIEAKSA
jgi:hypothetical protein